eukprot:CAMPEP_0115248544 /NCGR_PEP_ID=MMETSP0270-20121206/42124_1 /TAXON_ID=71861 /ORGANISM="Scrippsiella trochoidea, Strain CCMP3099" /LENGTH=201 /DNA_ID=CAMNT_0002663847 /DNA_START=67 /DNA_END=672 /DNA_ORIENTATION=+
MASGAAACVGMRHNNGTRLPPSPFSEISPGRQRAFERELRERRVTTGIFQKYDTDRSGKLEPEQLKSLLTDLSNRPPSELELSYILKLCDDQKPNGAIDLSELQHAIQAWKSYVVQRDELQAALDKFDVSGSGKLEQDELKAYLTHLNGGREVPDAEVDWVMSQANIFGDGACSKPELAMATAAWYTHVEKKQVNCACTMC